MATLEQIQAKLKKLQAQAEVIISKRTRDAVDKIRALMREHGLSMADVEAAGPGRAERTSRKGVSITKGTRIAVKPRGTPKYRHPQTGATWTGHGRAPAWIASSRDRTKFLIEGGHEATVDGSATQKKRTSRKDSATATRAATRKGQLKVSQPAIYRDPKTGSTWSGRGRAPAWLGKDRSKFLIEPAVSEPKKSGSAEGAPREVMSIANEVASSTAGKKTNTKSVVTKKTVKSQRPARARAVTENPTVAPASSAAVAKKVRERKPVTRPSIG